MTEKAVSQKSKDLFMRECTILRVLSAETCLTLNFTDITKFYTTRIGIHPVLESWEELRQLIINVIAVAKQANPEGKPFHIRFAGGGVQTWLVMKVYSLCVYEADALFYAGDCIIKI